MSIAAIFLMVLSTITLIDGEISKRGKRPIFVIPTATYKDGGSKRLTGIGYTVTSYHRISVTDMGGGEYKEAIMKGSEFKHWIFPITLRKTYFEDAN